MNVESKTMFGWDMDKNLDDFITFAEGLKSDSETVREAEAIEYLIERCKISEKRNEMLMDHYEQKMNNSERVTRIELELDEYKQRAEIAEAKVKELETNIAEHYDTYGSMQ